MRFLATADWQLGMAATFLDDEARPRFQQARLDTVRRIAELATSQGAGFVVVAGDVFESNQLDRTIVARACDALAAFTVPVVLLPGNHDPLDAASLYHSSAFLDRVPEHVHVIRDSTPVEITPGVEIVGAPWFSKRPLTDLVAQACTALEPAPAGVTRVIVGHGAVSTLDPDRDSLATIDVPALREVISSGRAHAAILGDRHGTYEVAEAIWYPGAPEVTARREVDPGNVLCVDIDTATAHLSVEKIHTGQWVFTTLRAQLYHEQDVEELHTRLTELPDKERTAIWLVLTGSLSTRVKARLDQVIDEARDLFALLDHWQRHTDLAVIPDGEDFTDLGLSGFAAAALAELTDLAAGTGEQAQTAQDSLSRLYQYVGSYRVESYR